MNILQLLFRDDIVVLFLDYAARSLFQSWIDENRCPELLEYDGDVVDCMLDQIHQMEANLKRVSKTDFKISIHKMEVCHHHHHHHVYWYQP